MPSQYLVVRGFGPFVAEEAIVELFRQFAVVKTVHLLRDGMTGISKGIAFVEFHTIEHAVHTLQQSSLGQLHLDSSPLKINFAKESFRVNQITKVWALLFLMHLKTTILKEYTGLIFRLILFKVVDANLIYDVNLIYFSFLFFFFLIEV